MKTRIFTSFFLAIAFILGFTTVATAESSKTTEVVKTQEEDYKTRIVEDSSLPVGVEIVLQEGKKGERTFYRSIEELKGHNGSSKDVPILSDEITKRPVEKVIRKGTNDQIISGISDKTRQLEETKAREKAEAEEKKRIAEEVARRNSLVGMKAPSSAGVTSREENREYARSILSAEDFACIDILANRESNWSTTATNPSSGAYGVAQSLPGNKMASAGADWQTNGKTQVNWMISYTIERYGSPCGAKAAWDIKHWY